MSKNEIDYDKLADAMLAKLRGMGLSRREMLAGLAGAGVGGLGLMSATGGASAQSIDGIIKADQLGTSSEPVQQLYVQNQTNFNQSETFDDLTVNNSADVSSLSADTLKSGGLTLANSAPDASGTATHTTGSDSEWVLVDSPFSLPGADVADSTQVWRVQSLQSAANRQSSSPWAVDWYFEWSANIDRWRFVLEWITDPGEDLDFDVEIIRVR